MAAQVIENTQTSLFEIKPYITGKKRVRYKTPTYTKKYSFWHINPETGEIQYNGDERHIFRVKVLHKLYSLIYGYCNINILEQFESKLIRLNTPTPANAGTSPVGAEGLIVWGEDKQAEIANTSNLSLGDRVRLHIKLLRSLRKGEVSFTNETRVCE